MSSNRSGELSVANPWPWRVLATLLILGASVLHLAYLASHCPLDLAPDEAHYWDWSRHLDWSYYSKGPLVAYLIRLGCAVAGPLSLQWTQTEMLAVRLPAVVCGALLLLSLYRLTVQVYAREDLACSVVAIALTLPAVAVGGSLMTIDSPYTCCWGWALVFGYQAVFRGSAWAWPLAGLVVGLGILAKYTMVLWVPSLGLYLLTCREQRSRLMRPGFWVMCLAGAACCVPILLWNIEHDWVSLKHVGGQAGLRDASKGVRWLGPLNFIAVQFALFLGFWFAAWAATMLKHLPWREADAGKRYLWWMSAPMFGVFLFFSFKTGGGEPNWPITAYISGLVLAVGWLDQQLQSPVSWYRRWTRINLGTACVLGLALSLLMHDSPRLQPLLLRLSGPATPERPLPLRRFDPTCRLRGWRTLAAEVDRVRTELREQGIDPVLAGSGWNLPGMLGFYCEGHPTAYSLGLPLGDRHSQYDFWRPNPVWDPQVFAGRTFIFVGEVVAAPATAFETVDPPRSVTYLERGQPIARWSVTVCRGYRGFGPSPSQTERRRY